MVLTVPRGWVWHLLIIIFREHLRNYTMETGIGNLRCIHWVIKCVGLLEV